MTMRWLLWKDYRQNRLIVYTALVLLLAPHLVALYAACRAKEFLGLPAEPRWEPYFGVSCVYSLVISQVAVALIGGNAIAGERGDRSAEFLFSLPIARGRLLASKLLLALSVVAVVWLVNAPTLWYLAKTSPIRWGVFGHEFRIELFTNTAITGLTFFCVAWFLSSLIGSPAYAACLGLLTPLIVMVGIAYADSLYLFESRIGPLTLEFRWRAICLTLSLPCFAVGTWHYLRRVEP